MKKAICLLTVVLMVIGILGSGLSSTANAASSNINTDAEGKVYSTATLDDNFADDRVMVVLTSDASLEFKDYTVEDFSEINCSAVLNLSTGAGQKVKQQYDEMITAVQNGTAVPETVEADRIDKYNQILCIKLNTHGKENVLAAIEELQKRNDIYYVCPSYLNTLESTVTNITNDTYVNTQWALEKIHLPDACDIATESSNVLVGVLDSGIDASHPDLANTVNTQMSRDFTSESSAIGEVSDPHGHGTHVAGIIAATCNNNVGVAGVCNNVTLVSLRVADANGVASDDDVASAIDYAEAMNIQIINMSFGRPVASSVTLAYEQYLENYSGLAVCSAGNYGANTDQAGYFPANYDFPHLITVGASTENDVKDEDSNFGKENVDLFAPGTNILSCYPIAMCNNGTHDIEYTIHKESGYHYMSGTSMAAPYVTGVAALMLSQNPYLTASEIRSII